MTEGEESQFCTKKDGVFDLRQQRGKGGRCKWHRLSPRTTSKVWLSQPYILTAGSALKQKYLQHNFPEPTAEETPPLQAGLLPSEEQATRKIGSEII